MNIYQHRLLKLLAIVTTLISFDISAVTLTYQPEWVRDVGIAGICTFSYPTLQPLSQPRTLVVDNHLSNGTVLYSWNYADFAPNFSGGCSSNISSSLGTSSIRFRMDFSPGTPEYYSTNVPGIGIKFYYTYHSKGSCSNCINPDHVTRLIQPDGISLAVLNTEYVMPPINYYDSFFDVWINTLSESLTPPRKAYFSPLANTFYMSIRAELIKVGNVSYNAGSIKPSNLRLRVFTPGNNDAILLDDQIFGSGGITIIPPSCRLSSPTDYNIDMGRWVNSGPGSSLPGTSLPAYGTVKPIDLKLECSGQVDSVQFKFEDAGSSIASASLNKNINLYDSIGGKKIEGLEIELSYGGNKVVVDNMTKTDTGSKGAIKTNPQDISFNSQESATFGARFIQTASIKKSGAIYTGPVTGKVNMYVTYN